MGSGIYLGCSLWEDSGDGAEVSSPVEILLDGARDDEALDAVDDAVGSDDVVGAKDLGGVDGFGAGGGVVGEVEVVVGGEGTVAEVGGGPAVGGDS